jgi:hypothetical protein
VLLQYEYEILKPGSTDDVAVRFTASQPLPNIQAGHRLVVTGAGQPVGAGPHPTIEAVDVYLFVTDTGVERTRVCVYLRGVSGMA